MNILKKSFIFGIAVFMAVILGAPAIGSQLHATSQPKYSKQDVAFAVRVSPGWGWGGRGYYGGYRYYSPGYRYHYYGPRYYSPYNYYWRY